MRKRFTESQIIRILEENKSGLSPEEVSRKHGVHVNTFYKWRSKYQGIDVSDARRLRHLEEKTVS